MVNNSPRSTLSTAGLAYGFVIVTSVASPVRAATPMPVATTAAAAPQPAASSAVEGTSPGVQRVQITGQDNGVDTQDTAIARVVNQAELNRYADGNVLDILRRQPGITVITVPGSGAGQIRMRGMSGGYVRILVDGDPAPTGFALDSISPALVERIDIIPVAGVEVGSQAIAGTINIVLKRTKAKLQREVKVALNRGYGFWTPQASGTYGDSTGKFAWLLTGAARQRKEDDHFYTTAQSTAGAQTTGLSDLTQFNHDHSGNWSLGPRLTYTLADGGTLQWNGFVSDLHYGSSGSDRTAYPIGPASPFGNDFYTSDGSRRETRDTLVLRKPLTADTQMELKGGYTLTMARRASAITYIDDDGSALHQESTSGSDNTGNTTLHATLRTRIGQAHNVSVGVDFQRYSTSSTRGDLLDGVSQLGEAGTGFHVNVSQPAVFAHDEWDISPAWSTDLGVRWEQLREFSTSDLGDRATSQRGILSPVAESVWHLQNATRDDVRVALSRSWRAPDLDQLSGATTLSTDNSFYRPDVVGNPSLKPELASGVDLSYDHKLPEGGTLTATAFAREISDVIVIDRGLEGPRWVDRPVNVGNGRSFGLELTAKFKLSTWLSGMKGTEVHGDIARYWSTIDAVPAPGNRVDGQIPLSANVGIDHKFVGLPLSWGGTVGYVKNGSTRVSTYQQNYHSDQRTFDAYGLWNISKEMLLRLAASNVLHEQTRTGTTYDTPTQSMIQSTVSPTQVTFRASLEAKF